MARTKKEFSINEEIVDEEVLNEEEFKIDLQEEFQDDEFVEEKTEEKKVKKKKEFGIVTLVSKTKVYYDYNGQSRYKDGKFDVKVGDKIEL